MVEVKKADPPSAVGGFEGNNKLAQDKRISGGFGAKDRFQNHCQ